MGGSSSIFHAGRKAGRPVERFLVMETEMESRIGEVKIREEDSGIIRSRLKRKDRDSKLIFLLDGFVSTTICQGKEEKKVHLLSTLVSIPFCMKIP